MRELTRINGGKKTLICKYEFTGSHELARPLDTMCAVLKKHYSHKSAYYNKGIQLAEKITASITDIPSASFMISDTTGERSFSATAYEVLSYVWCSVIVKCIIPMKFNVKDSSPITQINISDTIQKVFISHNKYGLSAIFDYSIIPDYERNIDTDFSIFFFKEFQVEYDDSIIITGYNDRYGKSKILLK